LKPLRSELSAFIEHAREKGMDHATIRMLLLSSGWKEKDVVEALAQTTLEMPVPPPPDRGGAREAFFHLLTFAGFYAWILATVILLFQYIEIWFPDAAAYDVDSIRMPAIRWSVAVVIVSFPVFLSLSRLLLREMRANPERAWSATRRWLTFLTLFLASIALGCDVIALVFRLLGGELTTRFLLKAMTVLLIAGAAFVYYFLSLRMPVGPASSLRLHRGFGAAALVLALGTVVWGFSVAGSPSRARLLKLDERRVEDLRAIQSEIENLCLGANRWAQPEDRRLEQPLPSTLEEVEAKATLQRPDIRDPQTGEPYGYEALDERRYRLCATFEAERDEDDAPAWNHPAGHHCFELDVLRP
jgi:hypothetical protein